jgi:hypothetical protein
VVEVGDGKRPVRFGAPAHREVAARDENQVALERAGRVHRALPVDRRDEAVLRAQLVERHADRKELAHGCDQRRPRRVHVVDGAAASEVDDM